MYWMDYLGVMQKMPFGAHGHGAAFCLSIFDREYKVRVLLLLTALPLAVLEPCLSPAWVDRAAEPATHRLCVAQEGMTLEEGIELMDKCQEELKKRFLIACPRFIYKVADKDGVRVIDQTAK
jgi:20S proteasome subunit beta 4